MCKDSVMVQVGSTVSVIGLKSSLTESRIESVEEFKIDFIESLRGDFSV